MGRIQLGLFFLKFNFSTDSIYVRIIFSYSYTYIATYGHI